MSARLALALALAVAGASAGAIADDEESKTPPSRTAMRLTLEQAGDPALEAQKRYFPEHYDALIARMVELQHGANPKRASQELTRASRRNWTRYNELVRQGDPADWRALVERRRDIFALIDQLDGAQRCLAYERRGPQALAADRESAYRDPVGAYIEAFLGAAARARAAPRGIREIQAEDLDSLYATLEATASPELMAALHPGDAVHPRFCEAMVAIMNAALTLEGEAGALVWRFLVTTGDLASPED